MPDTSPTSYRSTLAGALRAADAGREVRLAGWVHRRRDLGGLVFIDLRDRSGRVQLSFGPDWSPAAAIETASGLGAESVIAVRGTVVERPVGQANPELETGEIEVHVASLDVLGRSETPPIQVARGPEDELPSEELRLRYRYLDLRRPELRRALHARHQAQQVVRRWLSEQGFWEIETPMLTRRTPEGARDYLVPSRIHPGEFYALPQSPQLYKQLLMVSGYDRYFQIARCLRDEDLRADRQPEFTQIDAEMSFVDEEDVLTVGEGLMAALWREILGVEIPTPFPRMTYRESIERYGTDKPDLRFGLEFTDVTDVLQASDFRMFTETRGTGRRIRGFRAPGGASLSRRQLDELNEVARAAGAPGALWLKRNADGWSGQFAKALGGSIDDAFAAATGMVAGDLFVAVIGHFRGAPLVADSHGGVSDAQRLDGAEAALDALRRHVGGELGLRDPNGHAWVWITEFPFFEWDVEANRLVAAHHPFTQPHPEDLPALLEAAGDALAVGGDAARMLYDRGIRARAYDAVYNGNELASGSVRIHDQAVQRGVFRALGIDEAQAEAKFGFLLEAFRYGAPPHAGFAFGFDRLVMLLIGASSLRDVIAFPKTTTGRALFEGAPAAVDADQLRELHLEVKRR
ncbi:MAG TPA: aspartate--tRNA ligase [Longimicrobiales bacterium]|nr:aspartate--tRNA ligase [Longimicrobiales bacterium]